MAISRWIVEGPRWEPLGEALTEVMEDAAAPVDAPEPESCSAAIIPPVHMAEGNSYYSSQLHDIRWIQHLNIEVG